ncbi:MAG: ydhC 2 [Gammaproteobacteria bacterium]|jgi:DHA1 family 2-module integral membrane pump EmrD-like MFS transporter|nr:ydhC 2 [Gammaproteobacteria bacterium]
MNSKLWAIELNRIYMDFIETIILPSLPAIALYFMAPNFFAQLMVPAYLGGKLLAKLTVLTDVAEKYGKKRVLICFLFISLLGSLIALTPNLKLMLIGRVIQGAGVGCITSISTALVKEICPTDFITAWSKIGLINVWTPLTATFIGGCIQSYFGWQYSFVFLFLFGVFIIWLTIKFVPTSQPLPKDVQKQEKLSYHAFLNFSTLCEIIAYSLIYAGQAVIYTITPLLFIQIYQWPAHYYWIIILCFVSGLFLGKLLVKPIAAHIGGFAARLAATGLAILACLTLSYTEQLQHNIAPMVLALIAVYGFVQSTLEVLSRNNVQEKFPGHVSTGTAFMGTLQAILAISLSFMTAKYFHHEPKDMGLVLLGISIAAFIFSLSSYRKSAKAE